MLAMMESKKACNEAPSLYDLKKKSGALEKKIAKYEQDIETISLTFADFDYGSPEFTAAENQLAEANKNLKATMTEWELIQKQIFTAV